MIAVVIAKHYGKIFGKAWESVIAEFGLSIKATECAVQMQDSVQGMNENTPQDYGMNFRIGINH